jgi:hypothetical protein
MTGPVRPELPPGKPVFLARRRDFTRPAGQWVWTDPLFEPVSKNWLTPLGLKKTIMGPPPILTERYKQIIPTSDTCQYPKNHRSRQKNSVKINPPGQDAHK